MYYKATEIEKTLKMFDKSFKGRDGRNKLHTHKHEGFFSKPIGFPVAASNDNISSEKDI